MFDKLGFALSFIRDMFFESSEEMNIKSSKFNASKMLLFLFVMLSLSLNTFLVNRVFALGMKITILNQNAENCVTEQTPPIKNP